MTILLLVLILMVFSTVLVVAAGMLSSRLSRQEGRSETFEQVEATDSDLNWQSIE